MAAPAWHDPRLVETRTLDTPVPPPRARDLPSWQARAQALRLQVMAAAGLPRDAAERRPPPPAAVFERRAHPELGYAVEKVLLETLPGYFLTGNLYRPSRAEGRRPGVLHPHGHAAAGRLQHDALFSPALRGITFARMGYCAFVYDMVGYGDNLGMPHSWGGARSWLWGASPLGLQTWNSLRALDFLASLPDVDPERLGCTGESGGGTQTFLLTAIDPRVRVSAPVNMVSLHMQGGCVCENAPGLRLDTSNVEIAALAAPRPLLLVSATGDWTRHTPDVEYPAVAEIYGLYGEDARARVGQVQFSAPHNYNRASREAVYGFFRRWLPTDDGSPRVPSEDDIPGPDPEVDLRVFARRAPPPGPEGQSAVENVIGWYRTGATAELAACWPRDPAGVAAWRTALLPALRATCGVSPVEPGAVDAVREGPVVWLSRRGAGERFALRRLEAAAEAEPEAAAGLEAPDGARWAAFPFGTGAPAPWGTAGRASGAPFFLCYNRADAALRAQDLLTAVAWLGGRVRRLAAGAAGAVPAVLARAVAPEAVAHLELELGGEWAEEDPEAAWLVPGHYLPGVLRVGGLAGLLAMAAPASVCVRGAGATGLAPVAALYSALGAGAAWSARSS